MYTNEILTCKISITKIRNQVKPFRRNCVEVPVPIGMFTIAELKQIINEVEQFPYKKTHLFGFHKTHYLVRVYSDDPDRQEEDDKGRDSWVG